MGLFSEEGGQGGHQSPEAQRFHKKTSEDRSSKGSAAAQRIVDDLVSVANCPATPLTYYCGG